jgi:hypothetical protein
MLTDAQVQAHADRIRGDGFTVIEAAVNPELVEGLITALQRIECEHHLGPARTSFEGFKTVRINNLLTYDDLFWEVPLHDNVLPVVERVLDRSACCRRSARWCWDRGRRRSRSTKTRN